MLSSIRQIIRNSRNRRFLRRWARCRDGDVEGKYYIKRMFEDNASYYDLYWHIKSKAGDKHVDTLYLRAGENFLIYIIKNAEKTELPLLLEKVHGRETEKKKYLRLTPKVLHNPNEDVSKWQKQNFEIHVFSAMPADKACFLFWHAF